MKLFKKKTEQVVKTAKQNKPAKPAPAKADSTAGKSLQAWIYQPVLAVVIILVLTLVALDILVFQSLDLKQQSHVRTTLSSTLVQGFDHYIQSREREITALAKTNQIRIALTQETEYRKLDSLLTTVFSDVEQLYLVSADQIRTIGAEHPELSFASLDIMNRAAQGKPVRAEAFFHNNVWLFQIALPIMSDSKELLGAMLVLFNISAIKPVLTLPSDVVAGKVSLVSRNGGQNKVVVERGAGSSDHEISVDTAVAQWRISYAPDMNQLPAFDKTLVWIIIACSTVILALLVFMICRTKLSRVRSELITVTQYLRVVLSGETQRKLQGLVFAETNTMAAAVAHAARERQNQSLKQNTTSSSGSDAASAGQQEKSRAGSDDSPLFDDDLLDLDVLSEAEMDHDPREIDINNTDDGDEMLKEVEPLNIEVPLSIFRAYDIRGVVDETLNEEIVELIGKALASEALSQGHSALCVAYDGRLSSADYCDAITRGITSTGVDVFIVGQVPTPTLYFATHHYETGSGVMITGSHNPGNYNGFKMMLGGNTLANDDIQKLYNRILLQDFSVGQGVSHERPVSRDYLNTILNDIAVAAPLRVVLDAGNGVAGELAPALIEELGCEVIPLHCEIDGNFPNHHPDPGKPENLQDLIAAVAEHDADIGLAFDGDGDRIGVVTNKGKIIWPDRLLMLFAKDVVSRNPGADVIFDVKCSRRLNGLISSYGGRPIMWKTGHSLIKSKMKETGALLAGEMSGHVFFKERWYGFDDGLYSAARLLEILGVEDRTSDEVFADFPEDASTPEINVAVTDESKFAIVEKLCTMKEQFAGGNVSTIDGLRVDYPNGWGLCRASNTTPVLVLRFEADDESSLEEIKDIFKAQLMNIEPELNLNF